MGAEHVLPDRLEPDSTRPKLLLAIAGAVLLLLVIAFGLVLWFYTANVPAHGPTVPKRNSSCACKAIAGSIARRV